MTPPYRDLLPLVDYESDEKSLKDDVMPEYQNSKSKNLKVKAPIGTIDKCAS